MRTSSRPPGDGRRRLAALAAGGPGRARRAGGGSGRAPGLTGVLAAAACILAALLPAGLSQARDPAGGSPPLAGHYDIRILDRPATLRLAGAATGRDPTGLRQAMAARRRQALLAADRLRTAVPGARVELGALLGSAEVVSWPGGGRPGPSLAAVAPGASGPPTIPVSPASALPETAARGFLRDRADLFGMTPGQVQAMASAGTSRSRAGLRTVRLQQRLAGLPVFQGELRVTLDREGRLVAAVGRLAPGLPEALPASPVLTPAAAAGAALGALGVELAGGAPPAPGAGPQQSPGRHPDLAPQDAEGARPPAAGDGPWETVPLTHPDLTRPVMSRPVVFPLMAGAAIPARAHVIPLREGGDWLVVVDTGSGRLLYRKSLRLDASTEEARFSVYAQPDGMPADSPAPASPTPVAPGAGTQPPAIARTVIAMSDAADPAASPDGWIADGGQTSAGNSVDVFLDQDGDDLPDAFTMDDLDGRPVGNPDAFGRNRDFLGASPRDFTYTPPPAGGDPDAGDEPFFSAPARGGITQLFFTANVWHDVLHAMGFDEAAGNFQANNFGRGGLAGDPVRAAAQWGALFNATSNANISVTPDGLSPTMRTFLWFNPTPARDSGLDNEIVLHELTHGMTNRIIGDAAGLQWGPGLAMGEGWSDFYALSLLNRQPGDDPDGRYAVGAWTSYLLFGIYLDNYAYGVRRFPYSTDNGVNPLTWADVDETTDAMSGGIPPSPLGLEFGGAWEVHNAGEIWALSLWEVRSRIIAALGGDVGAGSDATLQIVTDALKLTPLDPSFAQARDALLLADCAASGCAHEAEIWAGFADRGLGYGSDASLGIATRVGVREAFDLPRLRAGQVLIDDGAGNGNGFVDPGESISLTVELTNPWRGAGKGVSGVAATLMTASPQVLLGEASSLYGPIPAQGSATGEPFTFTLDAGAACGQALPFVLQTDSELGITTTGFTLRVGQPAGPGAPVVFTRTIAGGLEIPEADPRGVADVMTLPEDLEIVDLDLRIDELIHTAVGDLSILLRSPGGFGADLVFRMADCDPDLGCGLGFNTGDNFIGTVIDDGATGDLMVAGAAAAPFTGAWQAAFNSPEWTAPDPAGQMGRYAGGSTQGSWTLLVADNEIFDTGRLNAWSLLVTPMAYTCDCAPLDPGADSVPSEVTGVTADPAGGLTLAWEPATAAGSATVHDVLRGSLSELPVGGGPSEICLAPGLAAATVTDGEPPPPAGGFWYLIRGRNACGSGPYGAATTGTPRLTGACPDSE